MGPQKLRDDSLFPQKFHRLWKSSLRGGLSPSEAAKGDYDGDHHNTAASARKPPRHELEKNL